MALAFGKRVGFSLAILLTVSSPLHVILLAESRSLDPKALYEQAVKNISAGQWEQGCQSLMALEQTLHDYKKLDHYAAECLSFFVKQKQAMDMASSKDLFRKILAKRKQAVQSLQKKAAVSRQNGELSVFLSAQDNSFTKIMPFFMAYLRTLPDPWVILTSQYPDSVNNFFVSPENIKRIQEFYQKAGLSRQQFLVGTESAETNQIRLTAAAKAPQQPAHWKPVKGVSLFGPAKHDLIKQDPLVLDAVFWGAQGFRQWDFTIWDAAGRCVWKTKGDSDQLFLTFPIDPAVFRRTAGQYRACLQAQDKTLQNWKAELFFKVLVPQETQQWHVEHIVFDWDSDQLSQAGKKQIRNTGLSALIQPDACLCIKGVAAPGEQKKHALAKRRMKKVIDYLEAEGLAKNRIKTNCLFPDNIERTKPGVLISSE